MDYFFFLISKLSDKKIIVILFSVGFLIYFNSLTNGFVADDNPLIVNNSLVHSISNAKTLFSSGIFPDLGTGQANNYYRPVETITYSVIYSIFGEKTLPFHALQLVLHISNAILIFLILKSFFKRELSFLLSLLFLVHPINTETVAYIAVLQDVQFLFFGLLALYLTTKKNRFYTTALITILLLLSLLSKESGFLFILIIPVFDLIFRRRMLLSILQSLIALIVYLALRFGLAHIYLNHLKIVPIMVLSLEERLINIPKIIFFYLKTCFLPKDLVILQAWIVKSRNLADFYLPLLVDIIFLGILISFGQLARKKDPKLFKIFTFFFAWFVIGLTPYLQIIPIDQTVSDRYFYFPIIGLLGMIGVIVKYFEPKITFKKLYFLIPIIVGIVVIFSMRVMDRNTDWHDSFSLYSHDIQINKDSPQLEIVFGGILLSQGYPEEARVHYTNATELFPSTYSYTNLGVYYLNTHHFKEAKDAFNAAFKYGDYYDTYDKQSLLYLANGDPAGAKKFIEDSLRKFPRYYYLWFDFAIAKYQLGDKEGAIEAAQKACSIYPSSDCSNLLEIIKNNQPINIMI